MRLDRVQRAERILEDHLHLRAVARARSRRRSHAVTSSPSRGPRPPVGVVQPREQARDGALAAAALADERGDRPGPSVKMTSSTAWSVSRRARQLAPTGEVLRQALDLERGCVTATALRRDGRRRRGRGATGFSTGRSAAGARAAPASTGLRSAGSADGTGSPRAGRRGRAAMPGMPVSARDRPGQRRERRQQPLRVRMQRAARRARRPPPPRRSRPRT